MNLKDFFVYILLPLAAFIFFYLKKKFSYFEDREIPHIKPTWPFGNMKGVGTKMHMVDLMKKIYQECKGKDVIAGVYSFTNPVYFITDLELAKIVTVKDFNSFMDRGVYHNEENEPLTANLFAIEGEKWKYLRNKLSPVFTSGKIKSMFNIISSSGKNLVEAIDERSQSGPIDAKDIANRFTLDVISSCAFGMDASTLKGENEKVIEMMKKIFAPGQLDSLKFILFLSFPKIAKFFNLRQLSETISNFFMNIVAENIKYREQSNDSRKDFLNMMIQLKNKGSIEGEFSTEVKKLTLNEVLAQAFLFLFAGSDTSSTTISFALLELANNQGAQDKLRREIIEKTKASNGELTYENLQEMIYLTQVMNETLRMYTPGFTLLRVAIEDYKIPNSKHMIPKGSNVWIPTIGFQYDESVWKNPEQFNPDRMSAEEIAQRPSFAFMPFGEGPRNCIGMRFGQLNVKYALASVIRNFKVTLNSSVKFPIKLRADNPTLEPDDGFMLKFQKIN